MEFWVQLGMIPDKKFCFKEEEKDSRAVPMNYTLKLLIFSIVRVGLVQYFTNPLSNMVVLGKRGYGIYFGLKNGYNIT